MSYAPVSAPVRILLYVFATIIVGALLLAAAAGWGIKYYNAPGPGEAPVTVIIPKGTGFTQITEMLATQGVIRYPGVFRVIGVVLEKSGHAQPGEYEFPAQVSPKTVLDWLAAGKTVIHRITIPEGWTTLQIMDYLQQNDKLEGQVSSDIQEGELLPETYHFSRGDQRSEIIARMRRGMRDVLNEYWEKRDPTVPFRTPQEALTMASIVEKETGIDSEYGTVASVYINRLRLGMLLQADPTVIYAVTRGKAALGRSITKADLKMESPYNTYVTVGLPPGPIANPGRKALQATLNPSKTDYIFFVANGSGGHNFSSSLEDHNKNVKEFRAHIKANAAKKAAASAAPKK